MERDPNDGQNGRGSRVRKEPKVMVIPFRAHLQLSYRSKTLCESWFDSKILLMKILDGPYQELQSLDFYFAFVLWLANCSGALFSENSFVHHDFCGSTKVKNIAANHRYGINWYCNHMHWMQASLLGSESNRILLWTWKILPPFPKSRTALPQSTVTRLLGSFLQMTTRRPV